MKVWGFRRPVSGSCVEAFGLYNRDLVRLDEASL